MTPVPSRSSQPIIALSIFENHARATLSKRLALSAKGDLVKSASANLVQGRMQRMECKSLGEVCSLMLNLPPYRAASFGVSVHSKALVLSQRLAVDYKGDKTIVTRTRDNFHWPEGPGVILFDYDPQPGKPAMDASTLVEVLREAVPEFRHVAFAVKPSVSSCIYLEGGSELRGVRGQHVFAIVNDAQKIPEIGKIVADRLWLLGHGYIAIAANGSLHTRTIVDTSVWKPEHLIFGCADCGEGLEQKFAAPYISPGAADDFTGEGWIEPETISPLTEKERAQVERLQKKAQALVVDKAQAIRENWLNSRAKEVAKREGKEHDPEAVAAHRERFREAIEEGDVLPPNLILYPHEGGTVTAAEVLADPDKWHGKEFADPIEPEYGNDSRIAIAVLKNTREPHIYSHAHHGICYYFRSSEERNAGAFKEFDNAIPVPIINVKGGGISDEATLGESALIVANTPIYQRSDFLVRPVIEEVDAAKGRRTKVAQLVRIDQTYLIDQLCKTACWQRFDGRKKANVRINPPSNVAQTILSRCGEWKFPTVAGVITTPTLRPDGTLLNTPGYDSATRLLLVAPPSMPDMPDRPTRDDALMALAALDNLISEFPFVDEASRSVAFSAMITPIVRGALNVVPMHAATAPTPGSGKSFLFDVSAAMAIGQVCPVMAAGRNEEETEKRLGAALLAGQPIISIDNFNGDLGGDALCQIIERPVVMIRPLGKSERVRTESRSTMFATGNNLRLIDDMTRRVIVCKLDAKIERPEVRTFERNPVMEVLSDRGRYIAAALTIVRAYIVAGMPNPAPCLASFEDWSDKVRSALIWLGCADPVKTMESAREDDPIRQMMGAVFTALRDTIGLNKPQTAAEIVNLAFEKESGQDFASCKRPQLRDALVNAVGGKSSQFTAKELGKWLGRNKERIAYGLRLEGKADDHGHAARWWLTGNADEAVESGCFKASSEKYHAITIDDII